MRSIKWRKKMANNKTLFEVIENRKAVYLEDDDDEKCGLPEFVERNLKYPFFEWQKSALENFVIFDRTSKLKDFPDIKNRPTHYGNGGGQNNDDGSLDFVLF